MIQPATRQSPRGFTLSELLISLAILGLIAVFTIPQVLRSMQASQNKTALKDAIASLAEISYRAALQNDPETNSWTFVRTNIAWTRESVVGPLSPANTLFLPTGAAISNLNTNHSAQVDSVVIDTNGPTGPNVVCEDQIMVILCWKSGGCPATYPFQTAPSKPGRIEPFATGWVLACNTEFFNSLFK